MSQLRVWIISLVLLQGLTILHQALARKTESSGPDTLDLIKSRGFLAELYTIGSPGNLLTLYRIINPLADPHTLNKYPVLYGHGVLYDAMSMISRSENSRPRKPVIGQPTINYGSSDGTNDHSLPFMMSNNNFDVWLFDARGTNFITRNITSDVNPVKAQQYWDFSLDDEALSDLPMLIDFVLTKTAATKLIYVGYSESTFFMFALLSTAPEYADKIAAFIAMAPVCYVAHIKGLTVPLFGSLATLIPDFVQYSFVPQPVIDAADVSLKNLCSVQGISNIVCGSIINGIGGKGVGEMTPEFFSAFFKSTSLKVVKQFIQLYLGKRFGMYDYGASENMKRFGQPNPPSYDLGRVRSDRIILFRGLQDFLSTPEDQSVLIAELGSKPYMDVIIPAYNHFDFIDGKDLTKLVNEPAMIAIYQLMYKDGPNIIKEWPQTSLPIVNGAGAQTIGHVPDVIDFIAADSTAAASVPVVAATTPTTSIAEPISAVTKSISGGLTGLFGQSWQLPPISGLRGETVSKRFRSIPFLSGLI